MWVNRCPSPQGGRGPELVLFFVAALLLWICPLQTLHTGLKSAAFPSTPPQASPAVEICISVCKTELMLVSYTAPLSAGAKLSLPEALQLLPPKVTQVLFCCDLSSSSHCSEPCVEPEPLAWEAVWGLLTTSLFCLSCDTDFVTLQQGDVQTSHQPERRGPVHVGYPG